MANSILEVVHETVRDLTEAGVMDQQTMRKFDKLCLPEVEEYDAAGIKAIRKKAKVSQAVFAAYLNTSLSTVRQWEQGGKRPHGATLKLLNLVAHKGIGVLTY